MPKYIINYTKHGNAISDFDIDSDLWFRLYFDKGYNEVSTENAILRIRLAIVNDEIPLEDVEIQFEGEPVPVNKYGAIHDWPKGFCQITGKLAENILRNASRKYRRQK